MRDQMSDARRREIVARVKEAARLARGRVSVDNVTTTSYDATHQPERA